MSGPQDAGSTHVLEAVIMATIMVSAVAYVATFETPPESGTPTRDLLKRSAQDALDGLYDTPVEGSSFGENALSVLLAECMGGNCTNLSTRIARVMPAGSSQAVYISNGYATFPVYVPDSPEGEAVTATRLLEPKWSHSFVATGTSNVNPTTDALVSYSLPVFNSNTLSQGGSPLRVLVHATRTSDGANYTLTGFYSTQAAPLEDKDLTPAATLTWRLAGKPNAAVDLTSAVLHPTTKLPSGKAVPLTLRLDETAGVPVPAGTELTVSLPRGWSGYADAAMNPGWTIVANATRNDDAYDGSDVIARLTSEVKGGGRDFIFNVTYHGDSPKYYPFHARLSKGALSEASLLVRGEETNQRTDLFAVPMVGMSVPRPMGATATTNWTLTVYLPDKVDESVAMPSASLTAKPQLQSSMTRTINSESAPDIVIHRIEIIEQDGARIFGDVKPVMSNAPGAWESQGDRLVWTGKHSNVRGPLSMVFNVTASGTGGATTSKNPFTPPLLFDDYKTRMGTQVAPGFHRAVTLPESTGKYGGYSVVGGAVGVTHDVRSDAVYKSTLLPGKWNYTLNPLPSFQDSIHGSYVNIDRRNVPLDGEVTVTADVQSLLFALSQAGISAGVNLHVYPPWAGVEGARTPIWSQKNLDAGLLQSDVTRMMLMDMNDDGRQDVIVGTSNGRVLALDGITGARLQGNVFTAGLQTGSKSTVTSVTHLLPFTWDGEEYIVVGTDEEGQGVHVLDKTLTQRWVHNKSGQEAVSMDTSVDIDGDGAKDILLGLSNSAVYALSAHDERQHDLRMIKGDDPDAAPGAFYQTLGRPTALVGLDRIGPDEGKSGFAVTFQSTPGVIADIDWNDPLGDGSSVGVSSLPRAGFQGVGNDSHDTWTFFGSPISVAQRYDYDGDEMTDIVAGSPAGYVHMMNGRTATQPLYSQLHPASAAFADADARDAFNMAALTKDGQARITTTGWNDYTCAYCSMTGNVPTTKFPQARAIAITGPHSFWLAGAGNLLLKSVPAVDPQTGEEYPHYPELAVVTPNGVQGLEDDPATPVDESSGSTPHFTGRTYDFNDIVFGRGDDAQRGWIVAGPCTTVSPPCEESLVMRTKDGGASWKVYGSAVPVSTTNALTSTLVSKTGGMVSAELTRINFTTREVGWVVGGAGTLLRTLDAGESFRGVQTPTTEALVDISCDPKAPAFCVLISGSRAWRTFNALVADGWIAWEEIALDVTATTQEAAVDPAAGVPVRAVPAAEIYSKTLKSVAVLNAGEAYVGAENMIFKSLDAAANWSTMPMNYLEADANRIVGFPDGRGFLFGGNVTHGRIFFMHDHAIAARAQTKELLDFLPVEERLAPDEEIVRVDLLTEYSSYLDTLAEFEVSVDGVNWTPLTHDSDFGDVRGEGATKTYVTTSTFMGWTYLADTGEPEYGRFLRVGMDLKTPGDSTLYTPQVRSMVVKALVVDAQDNERTIELTLDLRDPATYADAAATTAAWDPAAGVIHLPQVVEYWTRNVSGEVKSIATGFDVAGDERHEIWVATGGVLALNSPEHIIYAGTDFDKYVKNDNRVYLLDGKNGTILARTASFAGNVTNVKLADADGIDGPEVLFVTTWDPARSNGTLVALNPTNLTHLWTVYLDIHNPADLLAAQDRNGGPAGVVGTRAAENGQNAIPGKIYSFFGEDGAPNWGAIPDQQGKYVISKKIPVEWFFGPYVAEVEVTWTHEVPDEAGAGATRSILQRARFYDYFLVTPPAALAPPSPVYQVHLVSWFDDWR